MSEQEEKEKKRKRHHHKAEPAEAPPVISVSALPPPPIQNGRIRIYRGLRWSSWCIGFWLTLMLAIVVGPGLLTVFHYLDEVRNLKQQLGYTGAYAVSWVSASVILTVFAGFCGLVYTCWTCCGDCLRNSCGCPVREMN
jgi:hypothetical protein